MHPCHCRLQFVSHLLTNEYCKLIQSLVSWTWYCCMSTASKFRSSSMICAKIFRIVLTYPRKMAQFQNIKPSDGQKLFLRAEFYRCDAKVLNKTGINQRTLAIPNFILTIVASRCNRLRFFWPTQAQYTAVVSLPLKIWVILICNQNVAKVFFLPCLVCCLRPMV